MTDRSVILVPLDGSPEAEQAISLANGLVSAGGEIILLRVVQRPETFDDLWFAGRKTDEELQRAAEEMVQKSLAPAAAKVDADRYHVRLEVASGDPATEIIRLAEAEQVDLVVMTTHGRGGLGRAILGSVADRVVHHGTRPTLLLRGETSRALPDRVVVPLDGSSLAEEAIPVAAWAAEKLGAPVHLVHVVALQEILQEIWLGRDQDLRALPKDEAYEDSRARCEQASEAYLREHVEGLQAHGIAASSEVRTGTPAFVLLELLRPEDLAVMTTSGLGGLKRLWIGSVADKLIRQAAAPVLVVRPEPSAEIGTPPT